MLLNISQYSRQEIGVCTAVWTAISGSLDSRVDSGQLPLGCAAVHTALSQTVWHPLAIPWDIALSPDHPWTAV